MRAKIDPTKFPIRFLPVADLEDKPGKNPNVMPAEVYQRLVLTIRKVGFLQPVLVRPAQGEHFQIIDGHHRVRAAREIGMVEVPCVVFQSKEDLAAALALGMNTMRGAVDLGVAAEIVIDLSNSGWSMPDLAITGYTDDELESLLNSAARSTEEVLAGAETPPSDPETNTGPYTLELTFSQRSDLKRARSALRKAAGGKGKELSAGLLALIDAE